MRNTWDIKNGATDVKEKEKWYLVQEQQDHRRLKYRRRLSDYQSPCFQLKGAGAFHSAGQSKEGLVGFGTSQHPIFMKLLPDHLWH